MVNMRAMAYIPTGDNRALADDLPGTHITAGATGTFSRGTPLPCPLTWRHDDEVGQVAAILRDEYGTGFLLLIDPAKLEAAAGRRVDLDQLECSPSLWRPGAHAYGRPARLSGGLVHIDEHTVMSELAMCPEGRLSGTSVLGLDPWPAPVTQSHRHQAAPQRFTAAERAERAAQRVILEHQLLGRTTVGGFAGTVALVA